MSLTVRSDHLRVAAGRARGLWLVIALIALAVLARAGHHDAQAQRDIETIGSGTFVAQNFDADPLRGWELMGGARLEPSDGGRILAFPAPGHAFWFGVGGQDFELSFRYRHSEGVAEIVFRSAGEPPNHTENQVQFEGQRTTIFRIAGEARHALAEGSLALRPGQWADVTIRALGPSISVAVNGNTVAGAAGELALEAGGIALGCVGGGGFAYDDARFTPLAGEGQPGGRVVEPVAGRGPVEPIGLVPQPILRVDPSITVQAIAAPLPEGPAKAPPKAFLARIARRVNTSFQWQYMGGPLGGLGYDIRIAPANRSVMYVTDNFGGVFKSTNSGQHWFSSNGGPETKGIWVRTGKTGDAVPVFSLTIDPHNSSILWAGTKDQKGIFKSTDAGATWKKMDGGVTQKGEITFRGFAVDPRDSNIVYAAGELSSTVWAKKKRTGKSLDMVKGIVYKTTNGGAGWEQIWEDDNLARYVVIDPNAPDTIYVSTGIFDREAANSNKATNFAGGVGIVKSTQGGGNWQKVNTGLTNLYIGSLVMHPKEPSVLLAGAGCNPYPAGAGVFLTENGGQSWQKTLADDIITSVEFAPSSPKIAYAGSANCIYRSEDGGHTWVRTTRSKDIWGPPGIRAGWPIDFEIDPRDADCIYANNYGGGAFLSTDGGVTWTDMSRGYTGAEVRRIIVDPANPSRLFTAGRSGLFRSADGGATWKGLNYAPAFQLDWNAIALDPSNSNHLLAGTSWGAAPMFESFDAGQTWRIAGQLQTNKMGWRSLTFAPSNPSRVYAGTGAFDSASQWANHYTANGIYASNDGGRTWAQANDDLSETAQVAELAVDPNWPLLVYAATTTHGILKTTDGGMNWVQMNTKLPPNCQVISVAVNPKANGIIYCGLEFGGVYRSTDGAKTWQQWSQGMEPNSSIASIVFDPSDPNIVYAADTRSGVYRRAPGDKVWTRINHGLHMRSVNTLAFAGNGSRLYAGTEGNGVYRLDF